MYESTIEMIAAQSGVTPVGGDDGEIEYLTHCERGSFTVTVTNKPDLPERAKEPGEITVTAEVLR